MDTGDSWRGGQAQVYNLIKHLPGEILSDLLTPKGSVLGDRITDTLPKKNLHKHALRGEWDLSAAWNIRTLHRENHYDLIHAHSSHALGITWVASLLFDLPPFIETRRLELSVGKNWLSRRKYQATNHHVAISEPVRTSLVESNINSSNISVIPSGVDLEEIRKTEPAKDLVNSLGLDPEKPIVGNVGSLVEQKDHSTLILAARRVVDSHPNTQFVIAGKGDLRGELENQIKELNLQDKVVLAGFQKNIIGLIKTFDLFVLSSLFEGLCSTLVQVMASDVPIVATNVGGVTDLIEHGRTGRLVEPENPEAMSREILKFFDERKQFEDYSKNALKKSRKYDYKKLADQYRELYQSIVSEDKKP